MSTVQRKRAAYERSLGSRATTWDRGVFEEPWFTTTAGLAGVTMAGGGAVVVSCWHETARSMAPGVVDLSPSSSQSFLYKLFGVR
ncbi:hypothetical protein K491DRAFT_695271 [Lophiostoma macrostomum CBS 122681]|uniref:Uncharacterized protein n=1 Tax=Lophiostoma macrostomum CBS 122681 TaxID=1314788 RepID=A0A6A6SYX8_9PLEO|nr:hypothetical protein K491DRAFT_695271 [Lophiostoma macrostomum CBS 122681]